MARTRTSKASTKKSSDPPPPPTASNKIQLKSDANPPNVFILPKKANKDAKVATLPHPRTGRPARYLVCPDTGFYEFKKIAASKTTPQSWLIEARQREDISEGREGLPSRGQVTASANLFVATTIDPLFLVLPALADVQASKSSEDQKRLFLTLDDHLEKLPEEHSHIRDLLVGEIKLRPLLEARVSTICDSVEAGDETMFRLSEEKLVAVMLSKAQKVAEAHLPKSLEDRFVGKALEAPLLVQKSETAIERAASGASTPQTESNESQSTTATNETGASSVSEPSTAATSFSAEITTVTISSVASPEICRLQRLRVSLDFICRSYLHPSIESRVIKALRNNESTPVDFKPLEEYLVELSELRSEAVASRSMADYSRKRGLDEEEDEARQEKRRKLEEEKKKKANESRAVRDLKKVNTTGMKKMSDFFKKKT